MRRSFTSISGWIYLAFELGFLSFSPHPLEAQKMGFFHLLESKPEEVHLIVINSICYRMTGKFEPHFILSLLPIRLSERGKKDKNKTMESLFKLLGLYREKLCVVPTNHSSHVNDSWRFVWLFTRKYRLESGSFNLDHDHYCKITLEPSSCAQTCLPFLSGWRTPEELAHREPSRVGTLLMWSIPRGS